MASATAVSAQNQAETAFYNVRQLQGKIELDGLLNDDGWQSLDWGSDFTQNFPVDNQPAIKSTEFKITYDDQFIYVAVVCHQEPGSKPIDKLPRHK